MRIAFASPRRARTPAWKLLDAFLGSGPLASGLSLGGLATPRPGPCVRPAHLREGEGLNARCGSAASSPGRPGARAHARARGPGPSSLCKSSDQRDNSDPCSQSWNASWVPNTFKTSWVLTSSTKKWVLPFSPF